MQVKIHVDGMRASTSLIRAVEDNTFDMRPAFMDVAQWFRARQRRRWASAGEGRWAPLKLRTVRRRAGDARLMNRTGRLYRSLTSAGPGHIMDIRSDRMEMGTNLPYAKYHQWATQPRKPIYIRPTDRAKIKTIIRDHLLSD